MMPCKANHSMQWLRGGRRLIFEFMRSSQNLPTSGDSAQNQAEGLGNAASTWQ